MRLNKLKIAQVAGTEGVVYMIDSDRRLWRALQMINPVCIGDPYKWSLISGSDGHMLAIREDGTLWDHETYAENSAPPGGIGPFVQIENDNDWIQASSGLYHIVALKKDGTVWGRGGNEYSQIGGLGARKTFTQIGVTKDWVQVACGQFHTVALRKDGTLWGLGQNRYNQIGGPPGDKYAFHLIGTSNDWIQVSCGAYHTVAMKSDRTLWGLGYNGQGQLGPGYSTKLSPDDFTQISSDSCWSMVSGSYWNTVALKKDGTVNLWGSGFGDRSTGLATDIEREEKRNIWIQVLCIGRTVLFVNTKGEAYRSE
jgi:alpha-tubulin suppressor-like RCC1 family protein